MKRFGLFFILALLCSGMVTMAQGPGGCALEFAGCSGGSYVEIPNSDSFTNLSELTVEFWINQHSPICGNEDIVGFGDHWEGAVWYLDIDNGSQWGGNRFIFGFSESDGVGDWIGAPDALSPNVWHHVAGCYDGSIISIFVDGQRVASHATLNYVIAHTSSRPLFINHHTWQYGGMSSQRLEGAVDEVRISNVSRYDADFEVQNEKFLPDEHTIALYHFDECSGGIVQDASGNGHNGTLVSSPQ
jgi:hypothetical protein